MSARSLRLFNIFTLLILFYIVFQTLTPCMQSPLEDIYTPKSFGKLLGPALGDQQQGSFSINLWKSAFHDAFSRLCPVRSGGHECGCLPVLAKKVSSATPGRICLSLPLISVKCSHSCSCCVTLFLSLL